MKIIKIIVLLLLPQVGWTCSCNDILLDLPIKEMGWTMTETEQISSPSDIIFTGVFLDANRLEPGKYELLFKVIKAYKGYQHDTFKVRTNGGADACGFGAPINTECLIFALKSVEGNYYTYSSACCKSIAKAYDQKRYNKYIRFLESISNMIDGNYVFYQSPSYYNKGTPDTTETIELIRYNIRNGKLEGTWKITDRQRRVLETGEYRNGQKIGIWIVSSYSNSSFEAFQIKIERIRYKNGVPQKSKTTIEDKMIIWEEPYGNKTTQKQIIRKKYKYFKD